MLAVTPSSGAGPKPAAQYQLQTGQQQRLASVGTSKVGRIIDGSEEQPRPGRGNGPRGGQPPRALDQRQHGHPSPGGHPRHGIGCLHLGDHHRPEPECARPNRAVTIPFRALLRNGPLWLAPTLRLR